MGRLGRMAGPLGTPVAARTSVFLATIELHRAVGSLDGAGRHEARPVEAPALEELNDGARGRHFPHHSHLPALPGADGSRRGGLEPGEADLAGPEFVAEVADVQ